MSGHTAWWLPTAFGSITSSTATLSLATPPSFLWARGASNGLSSAFADGMPGSSKIQSVAADNSGSVFVAGVSDAITLDFGGAVLTTSVPTNGIALTRTSFIAKYRCLGQCPLDQAGWDK